jgi:20S proteasome subunit beta 7
VHTTAPRLPVPDPRGASAQRSDLARRPCQRLLRATPLDSAMAPPLRLVDGSRGARDASVTASAAGGPADPVTRTTRPMVTGSSIVGVRCADGVVLASDTLASYGSLARFREVERLHAASENCAVGVGGDLSDMQEILTMLGKARTTEYCLDDGYKLGPKAMYSYLSRVMYNRRNKMDPLWNSVVFAGWDAEDGPMLSMVDLCGGHFESEVIATGYGLHMGLPLLRKAWKPELTVAEGVVIVEDIMKVLSYRDARTSDRIQTAVVTKDGVAISDPKLLDTKWDYKAFVSGARATDVSTW